MSLVRRFRIPLWRNRNLLRPLLLDPLRVHLLPLPAATATAACAGPDLPAIVRNAVFRAPVAPDLGILATKACFNPVMQASVVWSCPHLVVAFVRFRHFTQENAIACLRFKQ